jgi:hypothetical protein
MEAPNDFDAAKSRDLEWAIWTEGAQLIFLPRHIRVRNCGYVPPPDPGPKVTTDGI